jgi:hypothetical protein
MVKFAAAPAWHYNGGVQVLADMLMSAVKRETPLFTKS